MAINTNFKAIILASLIFPVSAQSQINLNIGNIINKIATQVQNRDSGSADPQDQAIQEFANKNKQFIDFSKKHEQTAKDLEVFYLKSGIKSPIDCKNKKFRFKDICLGITIQDFSKILRVGGSSAWDVSELRRNGINATGTSDPLRSDGETKSVTCHYLSPKVYDRMNIDFPLPYNFRQTHCQSGGNTLFGKDLAGVEYDFLNGRLYRIKIKLMGVNAGSDFIEQGERKYTDGINVFHDEYKKRYQEYFNEPSSFGELISEPEDNQEYTRSGPRELIASKTSTWTNKSDESVFSIISRGRGGNNRFHENFITIFYPTVTQLINLLIDDVSRFQGNEVKNRDSKDF